MAFVFPAQFDSQPTLKEGELTLRPLYEQDRDALAKAGNDPLIWAGHPAKNRHERAIFDPYFDMLLTSGSALVICEHVDHVIGCTVFYTDTNAPSRLSVGFTFLTRDHWGGKTNRIVKRLSLGHIFSMASEAWFHIAPTNHRSQTATTRLGAVYTHDAEVDLGGGAQRWGCYCLTRENWDTNERLSRANLL